MPCTLNDLLRSRVISQDPYLSLCHATSISSNSDTCTCVGLVSLPIGMYMCVLDAFMHNWSSVHEQPTVRGVQDWVRPTSILYALESLIGQSSSQSIASRCFRCVCVTCIRLYILISSIGIIVIVMFSSFYNLYHELMSYLGNIISFLFICNHEYCTH